MLDTDAIDVFAVEGWAGPAERADGTPAGVDQILPGFMSIDREATVWNAPAGPGWRRGWSATGAGDDGTLRLDPGAPLVWNIAVVPSLLAQFGWALAVVVVVARRRTARSDGVGCHNNRD